MKKLFYATFFLSFSFCNNLISQNLCTDTSAIYIFEYDGKNYGIVKDKMTWTDASACSYQLGGLLARIDDQAEQNAIMAEISNAGITNSNTVAPDGGGASYLWLGGNDLTEEGKWNWIGENAQQTNFWQGNASGSAVDGLYNNWVNTSSFGGEPDNYMGNQNGLGLALTAWPYGSVGQWNDLNHENLLYFIMEIEADTSGNGGGTDTTGNGGGTDTTSSSIWSYETENSKIYPNPTSNYFKIDNKEIKTISIINVLGQNILQKEIKNNTRIDVANLEEGIYIVIMLDKKIESMLKK
jgi:hypothetical protein